MKDMQCKFFFSYEAFLLLLSFDLMIMKYLFNS